MKREANVSIGDFEGGRDNVRGEKNEVSIRVRTFMMKMYVEGRWPVVDEGGRGNTRARSTKCDAVMELCLW